MHRLKDTAQVLFVSIIIAVLALACGSDQQASDMADDGSAPAASEKMKIVLASQPAPAPEAEGNFEWPQWLGPDRNGISAETGLLNSWPENGLKELWSLSLGNGFSGIVIAEGKGVTMGVVGQQEALIAFDPASGKKLWDHPTDKVFPDRAGGDGPRATPAVENGIVYTYSAYGVAYAVKLQDGSLVWKADLRELANAQVPRWGFSTSPLIEGEMVIVEAGGGRRRAMVALDKKSGEVVWKGGTDRPGYSSPIAVTIGGKRQIVAFTGTKLMGLSAADGAQLWETPWSTSYDVNAATPVFLPPNKIFISTEYDVGAALYQINQDGDQFAAEQLWKVRGMKNKMSTSIAYEGYLYGFDSGILKCISIEDGKDMWKVRGYGEGSLMFAEGKLYALGDRGKLGLIEASPEGFNEISAFKPLNGTCWTIPTISNGVLYVRNENTLLAFDIRG